MEHYEEWLAFLATHLTDPIAQQVLPDGSVTLVGGDPPEVIVQLTESAITVYQYAVYRESPTSATVLPLEVGSVVWERIRNGHAVTAVRALIQAARASRLAAYVRCESCDQLTPPEGMHDAATCEACTPDDPRVVH